MLRYKQEKSVPSKGRQILISINVVGSAGPIRFVVHEDELVASVIRTALKKYAREGRLPVLGSDLKNFVLYCPMSRSEAINPWEAIGSAGVRNFMLFKMPEAETEKSLESPPKGGGSWKSWLNKSLNLKIPSQ